MKKLNSLLAITLSIILTFLITGCGKTQPSQDTKQEKTAVTLTVSAAASLKDSMEEIKKLYVSEKPNVSITYNFGASGSLQQQIEQGAPADIFISAANKQMKTLQDKSLIINDTKKDLLENKVVLVTNKDNSNIKDFNDLATDKVKKVALGEPKSVPAGQYAQEVLTKLNILEKVQPKAVFAKDVKEVLTWVETSNVDAGIVYETDAKLSQKVNIVAIASDNSHSPIIYPAAVIKASKNVDESKDFINFLSSDKASQVFKKYGFNVIKK